LEYFIPAEVTFQRGHGESAASSAPHLFVWFIHSRPANSVEPANTELWNKFCTSAEFTFEKLPRVLILVLKRWVICSDNWQVGMAVDIEPRNMLSDSL
jgi:hypothetical protein